LSRNGRLGTIGLESLIVLDPAKSTTPQNLEQRYKALLTVAESITSCRELGELFERLAADLETIVEFDYLALFLHDSAKDVMRCHLIKTRTLLSVTSAKSPSCRSTTRHRASFGERSGR
jgi:hypothetical protein